MWRIRDAEGGSAERAAVGALVNTAYEVEAPFKKTPRYIGTDVDDDFDRPGAAFVLAEHTTDGVIGAIYLTTDSHGVHFGPFAVAPAYQRAGVGAALFAEAEARARAHPAHTLACKVVDVRPEMLEYYGRKGMQPTGRTWQFVSEERLKDGAIVFFVELAKTYDSAPTH